MSSCPDANVILDLAGGREELVDGVAAHLDGCAECRRLFVALAPARGHGSETVPDAPRALGRAALGVGARFGRYRIERVLGAGGMGVVYLAHDPELRRPVALKLLHELASGARDADRLRREARAAAKLSHPNVVVVYEAGEAEGRTYIALEYVEGQTLRGWRDQERRTWREIVALFRQAGEGLAAAHRAGLVHRDFKPDNVLVGADGRVKVTDFGLVRGTPDASSEIPPDSLVHGMLTHAGTVMGTPAYMAPEQLRAEAATAKSDQFSFCVSLYEALYRERPFSAASLEALGEKITRGEVAWSGAPAGLPRAIRAVLERGLAADPERRFPDMNALLRALGETPRRWGGAVVMGALAAGTVTAGLMLLGDDDGCDEVHARLDGIWDGTRRRGVQEAFGAEASPLVEALDGYAAEWVALSQYTCRGQRQATAPDVELARRQACLERRLADLQTVTDLLSDPDALVRRNATQLVHGLSPVARCDGGVDPRAGLEPPPPHQRAAVERARLDLARADKLLDLGKGAEALEVAQAALAGAEVIAYEPLVAEALVVVADARMSLGEPDAQRNIERAILMAQKSHHDEALANAELLLSSMLSFEPRRRAEAHAAIERAELAVERFGGDDHFAAQIALARGDLHYDAGDFAKADASYAKGLEGLRAALGPRHPRVAGALADRALVALERWQFAEGRALLAEAEAIAIESSGKDHDLVGEVAQRLGEQLMLEGDYAGAIGPLERARAISEGSPDQGTVLWLLGEVLAAVGRRDEAKALITQALAIHERVDDPRGVARARVSLARLALRSGDLDGALQAAREALAYQEARLGDDHQDVVGTLTLLGALHHRRGELAEMRTHFGRAASIAAGAATAGSPAAALAQVGLADLDRMDGNPKEAAMRVEAALAVLEPLTGPGRETLLTPTLVALGRARADAGDHAGAVSTLRRALAAMTTADPFERAEVRFALAIALDAAAGDRAEVRALVAGAAAEYEEAQAGAFAARAREWLATR